MGKKYKSFLFYTLTAVITIIIAGLFFVPVKNNNSKFLENILKDSSLFEEVFAQKLFISVWKTTANEYIDASLNSQNWAKWKAKYINRIHTFEDASIAISTMLESLNDPYTKFLPSNSFSNQKIIVESKITGIGIIFDKNGDDAVIHTVLENSPAGNANIQTGDIIKEINNQPVAKLEKEQITELIENSKDNNIKLIVKRNGKLIENNLKREIIPLKTMEYHISKDNIGIITLANIMGDDSINDFKNAIEQTNETKGIIIDLRNNYGGLLSNAVKTANCMMSGKKIVSVESRVNSNYQIFADDEQIFKDKPVVILVNDKTASSAEILAGTLRDNINAILVGNKTYGKNTIQQIIPTMNNTGLVITTGKYILPNGEDINKTGLEPDIISPDNKSEETALKLIEQLVKN